MPDERQIVDITSPLYHACGATLYRILPESVTDQIRVSNQNMTLTEYLEKIDRALGGNTSMRFCPNIPSRDELAGILPGDRVYVLDASMDPEIGEKVSAMYIMLPSMEWRLVGNSNFVKIGDYVGELSGLAVNADGKLELMLAEGLGLNEEGKVALILGPDLKLDENGKVTPAANIMTYGLCEFYYFRHPDLKPGFEPLTGCVIENAATQYPDAWAYLQTVSGQKLCKTEAEWQELSTKTYYTLADGTQIGFNGIGGVPFYAPNLETGSLRMPDIRGTFPEPAGFDSLNVGGVKLDGMRNIWGSFHVHNYYVNNSLEGCYHTNDVPYTMSPPLAVETSPYTGVCLIQFNSSRSAPVSSASRPRGFGILACAWLGLPVS